MKESASDRCLFLNGFALKIIAFVLMTIDHLGVFLAMRFGATGVSDAFRMVGRLAFPLFVFLLAEGMRLSHHKGKYILRVLLTYAIITIPETILVYTPALANMASVSPSTLDPHPFTDILFLGLVLYCLSLKGPKKLLALLPAGFIVASFFVDIFAANTPYFPYYLRSGYGLYGLVLALTFYLVNNLLDAKAHWCRLARNGINALIPGVAFGLTYLIVLTLSNSTTIRWMNWEAMAVLSGLILIPYSGKRGYDSPVWRIFSYSYFLLHMAVLYIIFSLV